MKLLRGEMQISEFEALVSNCKPEHYLQRAFTANDSYWTDFQSAIGALKCLLTKHQLKDLLNNKLQLGLAQFDEKQYIQIACETTINSFFGRKYPSQFCYEAIPNEKSKKNVDCSYADNGYEYFIEVKCPDFKAKEKISAQDGFKLATSGRLPNYQESMSQLTQMLDQGQRNLGDPLKPVHRQKNMDNTMKDFLLLAHEKFNDVSDDNKVNILVVCCGDPSDMQSWHSYMYAHEGLFTISSFYEDRSKYSKVDMVVLTNLYHRHYRFYEKRHLKDIWLLEQACNFVFSNPFRKSEKKSAMMHFIDTIPHYTNELFKYNVPGPAAPYVKDTIRIPYFIREVLTEKGTILF